VTDIIRTDPVRPSEEAIVAAALVVKAGGLAVLPSDTVYGLVADLYSLEAIERLYGLKERPAAKGLPVFIGDRSELDNLAAEIPEETSILMDLYWPGPLSIVLKKNPQVPDAVTGGRPTIAVRQPGYVVCQGVLKEVGGPLTGTSANLTGGLAPRAVADLDPAIVEGVDIIIDGGVCPYGVPSTILDVSGPVWRVLRQGPVTKEAIETAVGRVIK